MLIATPARQAPAGIARVASLPGSGAGAAAQLAPEQARRVDLGRARRICGCRACRLEGTLRRMDEAFGYSPRAIDARAATDSDCVNPYAGTPR